jgi:hypothetical protein
MVFEPIYFLLRILYDATSFVRRLKTHLLSRVVFFNFLILNAKTIMMFWMEMHILFGSSIFIYFIVSLPK